MTLTPNEQFKYELVQFTTAPVKFKETQTSFHKIDGYLATSYMKAENHEIRKNFTLPYILTGTLLVLAKTFVRF